jgi:hypothetical protein
MKTYLNKIIMIVSFGLILACADDSLDPIQRDSISKGSILTLRGDAFGNLLSTGCSNKFFKNKMISEDAFTFDVEFLSENPTTLGEVQVYGQRKMIDPANEEKTIPGPRVLLTTVQGSAFSIPSDGKYPQGKISIPLSEIITKLAIADVLQLSSIAIESDITLKDGTKIPASSVVNSGLSESAIFFPAHNLTYCVEDIEDYRPVASLSLREPRPLKAMQKDTLDISFDQAIDNPPSVTLTPNVGVITKTGGFYVYTAPGGYTGTIYAIVDEATSGEEGALKGMAQYRDSIAIVLDNTAPEVASTNAGIGRVGRGGFETITVQFNEPMSASDEIKISISGQNLDPVTNAKMTLSEDGETATYVYSPRDPDTNATHGPLTITITGGADEAGNPFGGTTVDLINDVAVPAIPTITLSSTHNYGTQIKWTVTESASQGGASTTGTVYFVAVEQGSTAPTQKTIQVNGVDFNDGFDLTNVEVLQEGSVEVAGGSSGEVFTPFTAKGSFDVYYYFVSDTGNVSPISSALPVVMN